MECKTVNISLVLYFNDDVLSITARLFTANNSICQYLDETTEAIKLPGQRQLGVTQHSVIFS